MDVNNIHAYVALELNSLGNNFQLEMRLTFFQQVLRLIYAIRDMSVLYKFLVPNGNTTLV